MNFSVAVVTQQSALIQFCSNGLPCSAMTTGYSEKLLRWVSVVKRQPLKALLIAAQLAFTALVLNGACFRCILLSIRTTRWTVDSTTASLSAVLIFASTGLALHTHSLSRKDG